MLPRLKQEFSRYYFSAETVGIKCGFSGFGFGSLFGKFNNNRSEVSTIIDNLVYLSNLPGRRPFDTLANGDKENAALVISCVDISELAESDLLLEPGAKRIKYHVVAMQDVTAKVGSDDHVYDALAIMSHFADCHKPIHIHCYSGVGRSAMITALHISHRYLLGDPIIISCLDNALEFQGKQLNSKSDNFISELYDAVSSYVTSKRRCCQFDNHTRNEFSVSVLTVIYNKIQRNEPIVGNRDENYCFLAELAQSPEFKKLQHYYYKSFMSNKAFINEFINAFLLNQDGWYQQLVKKVEGNQSRNDNKECKYYPVIEDSVQDEHEIIGQECRALLSGVRDAINRLSTQWSGALYSQQPTAYLLENAKKEIKLSNQNTDIGFEENQRSYSFSFIK